MAVRLLGYRYSVYSWIARLALQEKGVAWSWCEVDPFAEALPDGYLDLHPFRRVPVLDHDGFVLYETGAITRYVDEAFNGPRLQPEDPKARGRQAQIISIVDSYGYWPLVRQVFSNGVFRPRLGRPPDTADYHRGLEGSIRVLAALERLAGDAGALVGDRLSLADIHLFPMIDYFAMAADGDAMLRQHPKLARWYDGMSQRPAVAATRPDLPEPEDAAGARTGAPPSVG